MRQPNIEPDYTIEIATAGDDSLIGISPPVGITFREQMFDALNELGLIKEIVIRGGTFFEPKTSSSGTLYSELRISGTALDVAGTSPRKLLNLSREVLEEQGKTVRINSLLKSSPSSHQLFGISNS